MEWAIKMLMMVLEKASPEIRQALVDLVKDWEVKALATPNKVDDILVYLVKKVLLIEDES